MKDLNNAITSDYNCEIFNHAVFPPAEKLAAIATLAAVACDNSLPSWVQDKAIHGMTRKALMWTEQVNPDQVLVAAAALHDLVFHTEMTNAEIAQVICLYVGA